MKRILSVFLTVVLCLNINAQELTGKQLLNDMLQSIKKVNTLTYTLKAWERLDQGEKTQYNEMLTHYQKQPLMIYIKNFSEPNEGVEVLYRDGMLDGKVLVNAKSWLPNLKLDPYGGQLRKDQHHTIFNAGFDYMGGIVSKALARATKEAKSESEINEVFVYDGEINWNGIACYKVILKDPTFTYRDYTVKEGDDLNKLADRLAINAYLVVDKNDNVKWFDKFNAGDKVKLPTSYAKKTILYLDKSTMLPIVQIMHDENGQFEKYEFHNLKVNPSFASDQFTEDFDEYDF